MVTTVAVWGIVQTSKKAFIENAQTIIPMSTKPSIPRRIAAVPTIIGGMYVLAFHTAFEQVEALPGFSELVDKSRRG